MRRTARWMMSLGLASAMIAGAVTLGSAAAIALTEEQVLEKLRPVPLFTLTNAEGDPVIVSVEGENGATQNVARMFVSPEDAQAFLQRVRQSPAGEGQQLSVSPWSLAGIYALSLDMPEDLSLQLVPDDDEVTAARSLLQQNQLSPDLLRGIPLFLVTAGEGDERSYVTVDRDGRSSIFMFFDKTQAEESLRRFSAQQASLAASARIEVVDLGQAIDILSQRDDAWLSQIIFVPSLEAQDFLRQRASSSSTPPATP